MLAYISHLHLQISRNTVGYRTERLRIRGDNDNKETVTSRNINIIQNEHELTVGLITIISPVYAKTRQKSQLRMKVGMTVHHLWRSS